MVMTPFSVQVCIIFFEMIFFIVTFLRESREGVKIRNQESPSLRPLTQDPSNNSPLCSSREQEASNWEKSTLDFLQQKRKKILTLSCRYCSLKSIIIWVRRICSQWILSTHSLFLTIYSKTIEALPFFYTISLFLRQSKPLLVLFISWPSGTEAAWGKVSWPRVTSFWVGYGFLCHFYSKSFTTIYIGCNIFVHWASILIENLSILLV